MKNNMRTVAEVRKITGVSVRTLHHYDAIDLLKPAAVTAAGYRLYDDTALERLQSILLFREVGFSLKEIKEILDNPGFDAAKALEQQIQLLELRLKHTKKLISFAREIQKKGVDHMNFDAFSKAEIERYEAEAKRRWGATALYQEYEKTAKRRTKEEQEELCNQMMAIFAEIGALCKLPPDDQAVQAKIGALQQFITNHYYTCTDETLRALAQMYVGDERMKRNIDSAGGSGTADFASKAIFVYCAA